MKHKTKIKISPTVPIFWGLAALMRTWTWVMVVGAALAIHEAGHVAAMKASGASIAGVRIRATGLEIERGRGLTSYLRDAAISAAGPIISIAAGAITLPMGGAAAQFGTASLWLGALNALPVTGLDGGAALTSLLERKTTPQRAGAIMRVTSIAFTVALWLVAVWLMLATGGSASLFALSAVLFLEQLDVRK